jgi:class 3 adenylate cyclase
MKLGFPEIEKKLPQLDFGIGAHFGTVVDIEFHNIAGQSKGVLGSSINIASRVEQTTKEHPYRVIITKFLLDRVIKLIPKTRLAKFNGFWIDLDKHCLRGFDRPRRLYAFKPGFHKAWMCK